MIGPLTKKMLRTMYRSRGQVLAVGAVVLCGTASYISLASCYRNLLLTRDTYYAQNRFADFEIIFERAPNTAGFRVQEIPGVRQVRTRIVDEVKLEIAGLNEARSGRIVSMPDERRNVLNDIVVTDGRYFEPGALNEVILSQRFAEANGLSLGDNIEATIEGRKHTLRVVGYGLSPEFIYVIRNLAELVPAPERFGILWVPKSFAEDAFNMQAACNNIIGSADDPEAIDRILETAEDLLAPYGVYSKVARKDQVSNNFISSEIRGLGVQARVMPTIFLGVAALVIFIVLNRMVRNERTQIGLMKAYGYSNLAVAMHYIQYALFQTILGGTAGFVAGQLLARAMMGMYVQFYTFPLLESRIYPDVLARSIAIAVGFAILGAAAAAYRAARIHPAESMRPEAPRIGHRVFLERYRALWARLSFTWKMIARNVSRSKFRAGLNVFGVAISTALLIVAFYAIDAMNFLLDYQYRQTQKQDATISFFVERGEDALREAARFDHVREAEALLQYPFEMRNGWRKRDVVVIGMERDSDLQMLTDSKYRPVDVGESGLVLSNALAQSLDVEAGDEVVLKPLMGKITKEKRVPVSKIVEQYFGLSGYMNIEALSRVLDESYALNAVLVRAEPGKAPLLHAQLKDVPIVSSVELREDAYRKLQETIATSMRIMSVMSVFFAGVIAFAIIYNVTLVSLAERQRELASLRVLGFSQSEVGRILFNENFVTGALGLMAGVPMGIAMVRGMMNAFNTDLFRFPFYIAPTTYAMAMAMTVGYIVITNVAVRFKIRRLDLVETLKARE